MRWLPGAFTLVLIGCGPAVHKAEPYSWQLRPGFPLPEVAADNPMTLESVALGEKLFFDKALSANGEQSCASCHLPEFAFAEPRARSIGSTGEELSRNAPALVNIAYNQTLTWAHPQLTSLEQQLLIPLFNESPIELGATGAEDLILSRLRSKDYLALLERAYPEQALSFDVVVKALSNYVRSLVSFNSAFDAYAYDGKDEALSESAIRGLNLFFSERLECHHCHGGFNFTQSTVHEKQRLERHPFHNTGMYNEDGKGAYPEVDQGLFDLTRRPEDKGKFRAPTLRNIALTGPYMHDGSIVSLEEVIDFYDRGGGDKGKTSPLKSQFVKPLNLSQQEKQDLLAFLHSLTDLEFVERHRVKL